MEYKYEYLFKSSLIKSTNTTFLIFQKYVDLRTCEFHLQNFQSLERVFGANSERDDLLIQRPNYGLILLTIQGTKSATLV